MLKQPQYEPVSLDHETVVLYAVVNGCADTVPIERMKLWENELLRFMGTNHPEIGKDISEKKQITKENEVALKQALDTFIVTWR